MNRNDDSSSSFLIEKFKLNVIIFRRQHNVRAAGDERSQTTKRVIFLLFLSLSNKLGSPLPKTKKLSRKNHDFVTASNLCPVGVNWSSYTMDKAIPCGTESVPY